MRSRLCCFLLLSLGVGAGVGHSQERAHQPWIKFATSKFELYTDASGNKAKDLLELFERAESAALRPGNADPRQADNPLRIIAFAKDEEYAPFRLKSSALGHYLHTRERDYVVLADAEPEHFEAAVHEYTHYAVNRAGFHLPVWLNEGIADLYSTSAVKSGTPLVGAPLPGRLATLAGNPSLPLRDLFSTGRSSALYNDPQTTPLFYAESWAFTRMLALDSRYAAQFSAFLTQVSGGRSSTDALWSIYRMTPEQFEAELPEYVRQMQGGRPVAGLAAKAEQIETEPVTVSEFEQHMIWADLLAAHSSTAAKAKQLLLELEKEHPGDPRTQEMLGHIAWTTNHREDAQKHWAKAVELGSRDFETLYRLALLLHGSGTPCSEVIALMEKALAVKPDSEEAIYNLGVLKYGEGQYEGASTMLLRLRVITPDRAYTYYSVLAYCDMKMKTFDRAKAFLLKAAESARTLEEQAENAQMLRFAAVRAD